MQVSKLEKMKEKRKERERGEGEGRRHKNKESERKKKKLKEERERGSKEKIVRKNWCLSSFLLLQYRGNTTAQILSSVFPPPSLSLSFFQFLFLSFRIITFFLSFFSLPRRRTDHRVGSFNEGGCLVCQCSKMALERLSKVENIKKRKKEREGDRRREGGRERRCPDRPTCENAHTPSIDRKEPRKKEKKREGAPASRGGGVVRFRGLGGFRNQKYRGTKKGGGKVGLEKGPKQQLKFVPAPLEKRMEEFGR